MHMFAQNMYPRRVDTPLFYCILIINVQRKMDAMNICVFIRQIFTVWENTFVF